jgi:hypothetical protein
MCRFGQEGGAPIGGDFSGKSGEAPDWKDANAYLMEQLGRDVYGDLRFERRKLSMHDAELIIQRLGKLSRGK